MKQFFAIVLSFIALAGNIYATNTKDKLYTLDNKVYTGYIATQIPGKQVIFISDDQVIPFNFSDLLMIKFEAHDPMILTGLNDVIKTRDGKIYNGQITEQMFGKRIKILTEEGEETIDIENILEQQKVKMYSDNTLIEQAPYKTLIKTNKDEEYTGVIIYQYYGNEETSSYLELSSEDGISKRINISDITQMRRVANDEYREVKAFSVEDGKAYFNQTAIEPIFLAKQKKGKHITYYLEEKSIANHIVIDKGIGQLTIQMKEDTDYSKYKLMKINLMKIGKKDLYAYEEESAYRNIIDPYTSTIDSKKIMSKVYNVGKGMYIFYKQGIEKVFFVEIK